jgi:hypothetical protein
MKTVLFLFILFIFFGCQKEEPTISAIDSFSFDQPSHFPKPVYQFTNNKLTKAGFELGRFLFYDPIPWVLQAQGLQSARLHKHTQEFRHYDYGFRAN